MRILIVDDARTFRYVLLKMLKELGYAEEAKKVLGQHTFDIVSRPLKSACRRICSNPFKKPRSPKNCASVLPFTISKPPLLDHAQC
jgi:anthranilate/para-aminobenzoate synthase component II